MKAHEVLDAIMAAHCLPEWACFAEVRNATGANAKRSADAVALNLWPSRGLTVRGFEIKVSKADLRNEIAQPDKAEAIATYCDEWWIVTPAGLSKDIGPRARRRKTCLPAPAHHYPKVPATVEQRGGHRAVAIRRNWQ